MSAVENAFAVLEGVAEHQPVGVSELARRLEMTKSTAQRSLTALHDLGWITQARGDRTRWVLTTKAFILGSRHAGASDPREVARPAMEALFDDIHETIHLSVLEGSDVVVMDLIETTHLVRTHTRVGDRYAAHATASGVAIIAAMPQAEADEVLASLRLSALTPNTPTDLAAVRAKVEEARLAGYATARGTRHAEVSALGAAILDREGRPFASLSISVPTHRLPESDLPVMGERVRQAAESCSGIFLSSTAR